MGRDLELELATVAAGKARAEAMSGVMAKIEKRILIVWWLLLD